MRDAKDVDQAYARTARTELERRPANASYDREVVHAILDAGLICHVGFVVDGQPFVTPVCYWRMDETIYWHGSAVSRMTRAVDEVSVCVTVSHVDGIVLARTGFNSCLNYRSVMMFGVAKTLRDPAEKALRLDGLMDRLAPGRSKEVPPNTPAQLNVTSVMRLDLQEVSAKVRTGDVGDSEEDLLMPQWAGTVPVRTVIGEPIDDPMLRPGIAQPANITQIKLG